METSIRSYGRWGPASSKKDMYVEVNSMRANGGTAYGSGVHKFPLASQDPDNDGVVVDPAGHDHRPTPKTLTMVGDALYRAGVRVHFDVGPLEAGGTGLQREFGVLSVPATDSWLSQSCVLLH